MAPPGPRERPTIVGRMLPQPRVFTAARERVLLDGILGPGYALVGLDTDPDTLARLRDPFWDQLQARRVVLALDDRAPRADTPCPVVADVGGTLRRELSGCRGRFLLVRPDRFVAAVFAAPDERAVARGLRAIVGEPVRNLVEVR